VICQSKTFSVFQVLPFSLSMSFIVSNIDLEDFTSTKYLLRATSDPMVTFSRMDILECN
jgi:hypothetical protein